MAIEENLIGAIVGGFIGVCGTIAGGFFTVRYQARINARQIFFDTVHELLVGMYPEPINWPRNSYQFLQDCMPQMQIAVYKLRFHLRKNEVSSLNTAWEKYKEWCGQIDDAAIMSRPLYQKSIPSIDQKAVFKRHVENLLSYAQEA